MPQRDVARHRRWMLRNFSVGLGSVWVRAFGAAWALYDMSFMRDPARYRAMNDVGRGAGFAMGPLAGEWWLRRADALRHGAA